MTLLLTWLDMQPNTIPTIWTAADTQISSGHDTLTLEGSKILELNIVCKDTSTPIQPAYYNGSIGFSYAGSTMTAFNTYATLSTIMTNLGGSPIRKEVPDYMSLLMTAKNVLKLYTPDSSRLAEISLWGFCPANNTPFIGLISWNNGLNEYSINAKAGLASSLDWIILGDVSAKIKLDSMIRDRINKYTDKMSLEYWRSPYYPLREIIQTGEFRGVGGNIQLAQVNQFKFSHLFVLVPPNDGSTYWSAKYRNIDIYREIGGFVGRCFITISGMDMDFPHDSPANVI